MGATSLLSTLVLPHSAFAMSLPNAFTNPYNSSWQDGTITFNSPKTPGTYDTSGDYQVVNGDPLRWISQMSKNGDDHGQYVKEKTQFPDGTEGTSIMFNDADMGNKDNGFTLVSTDMAQNDVPDWITAMQGNPEYVNKRMSDPKYSGLGTLIDRYLMSQYSVIYAPSIVQWSGGRVEDLGVHVRSDGQTGDRVIKVIPTPPPTAQVSTDKPSYAAGDKLTINLTVNDYSANEGWQPDTNGPIAQDFHAEHLSVVKPDGSTIDLPIISGGQTYPAATGDNFPYSNHPEDGALYPVLGGGSGDPNTPKTYNETATLDTTGWPEGTYTVKFTVADSVNRRASNGTNGTVTATFTIGPALPQQPGTNDGNNGGTNGTGGSSNNNGGNGTTGGSSGSSGTQAGDSGSISQNPTTSDGDISVRFRNYLWDHWPKNGEIGHFDMILTNTNSYEGAGIEYDLKAWSEDNSLFQPIDIEKAVVTVPPHESITIPLTYKVQRELKNYKWQAYHFHYKVTIRPHVIPTSDPNDPPPPPLHDSDPSNDTAQLNQFIIGPPHLVE